MKIARYGPLSIRDVMNNGNSISENANGIACIIDTSYLHQERGVFHVNDKKGSIAKRMLREHRMKLDPEFPFRDEISLGIGTAFVVADDLMVTAGHCLFDKFGAKRDLESLRFAFNYRKPDNYFGFSGTFPVDDVYKLKNVVDFENRRENGDWALIQVDRPFDRNKTQCLTMRTEGFIENSTGLYVLGHPLGLPLKIADHAQVWRNDYKNYFTANLDTFGGNSGSPVFNARTHEVEGLLIMGEPDFYLGNYDTYYPTRFPDDQTNPKCTGEFCQRISKISNLVKLNQH